MDLFDDVQPSKMQITRDAYLLKAYALVNEEALLADLEAVIRQAPLRNMMTRMGYVMSVAMTNCGVLGWTSDRKGYRYDAKDPITGHPWPKMPVNFLRLANQAATEVGFKDFQPDACLINQYKIGARMGLHQDKNELDISQPIVSVSLGMPAIFQFGGLNRLDNSIKTRLAHGDVVVWGGESRLNFHGIMPIKMNTHPILGAYRYNLTFRRAG